VAPKSFDGSMGPGEKGGRNFKGGVIRLKTAYEWGSGHPVRMKDEA